MSHPDPPWSGWISTTGDALLILEAARRGLIPRVTRRLVDAERKMIVSGSVFVFDEEESGIKRWTDGYNWSPSRILGNFLLYRETGGRAGRKRKQDKDGDGDDGEFGDAHDEELMGGVQAEHKPTRSLVGSLGGGGAGGSVGGTSAFQFKANGLMKKTFSLTINGVPQHLISYYRVSDVTSGRLRSPSSLPELASLDITEEYLDKTHFRVPPKMEIGSDGRRRYRGEADEEDVHGGANSSLPNPVMTAPVRKPKALLGDPVHVKAKRPLPIDTDGSQGSKKRKRSDAGVDSSPLTPQTVPSQAPPPPPQTHPYPPPMYMTQPHPYYAFPPYSHTSPPPPPPPNGAQQPQPPPPGYPMGYPQQQYPYPPPPADYYAHPYYTYMWPPQQPQQVEEAPKA